MKKPSVGIVLPSQRKPWERERNLVYEYRAAADAAASAGAETLWVWDHMLKAPVYRDSWHDPMVSLAAVADFGLRLGTGVLVAPVRPPVQTAMAVATLQSLSGKTMRLGVGTGWNPTEFQAAGVTRQMRGGLTDEFLAVTDAVFSGERDFSGKFHNYENLDTGQVGPPPDIWVAGGSRAAGGGELGEAERLKNITIAPKVAQRILKYRRWLLRPTAELQDFKRDIEALAEAAGPTAEVDGLELSTILVGHLVETDEKDEAHDKQLSVFESFVTEKRPPDYLKERYLLGSLPEIRERLNAWLSVGMEHVGLYLLGDVPEQVAIAQKHFSDILEFS